MGNCPKLGFGIMRMPQQNGEIDWKKSESLIDEYMKGEYCYFDTHPSYMMNQSQKIIREFVVKKYNRSQFVLANKMPYFGISFYDDYYKIFNQELKECGVEYFDYYLLHAISKDIFDMHTKLGGFHFLKEIKKTGKSKFIGFSFYDKAELLEEILKEHPEIDVVQLQINYFDWENPIIQSKACYEIARKYEKIIIAMEPIKGGSLARGIQSREYARKALQFVKGLPGIQVVLSGMAEIEHIRENRCTLEKEGKNEKIDLSVYQKLKNDIKKQNYIQCTECRYCVRECPRKIKIPEIFSLINAYYQPGNNDRTIYWRMQMLYKNTILGKGSARECIDCGKCECRCPQKISIRENLKKGAELFEKKYFYTSERNAQILIYLLKEYGIKKIIASPGATNVAFIYSVQQDDYFEIYSAPDERSAAYMACGLAEESGQVVALSCTGATASRNYIPGLTEAFYRNIPILAITSSQSSARIGHNVPQMTDRRKVQDDVVKISVEMPIVKDSEDEWICTINANKAINELWHKSIGPVHINLITSWNKDFSVKKLPSARVIRRVQIKDNIPNIPMGKIAIFCGSHKKWDNRLTALVDRFCEKYDAFVICDHTSNYVGNFRYTPVFFEEEIQKKFVCNIELLIHIGSISGAYFRILAKEVWRIHPDGEYRDTFGSLSYVFEMDEQVFFDLYVNMVTKSEESDKRKGLSLKINSNRIITDVPFSNAWIASQTAHQLPENSVLHLGILNSLRVWNFYSISKTVRVYANTGGFGIDGCLSTLIGASLSNPEKLYFGVLGDLAFFYDMNSLGNRHIGNNIRLLVINNGCGTEFKNYNHSAQIFGMETDLFIAAKGHYGNKSNKLLKNYAENLGFFYASAYTKMDYQKLLPKFVCHNKLEKPMLIEIFTNSIDESEALKLLNGMSKKNEITKGESKTEVPKWFRELSGLEIVLWGCGHNFRENLSKVEEYCKIKYVCDNNSELWNLEVIPSIICISPDELKKMDEIFVVIMIEDAKIGFDIAHQLQMMGVFHFDLFEKWLKYAQNIKWK